MMLYKTRNKGCCRTFTLEEMLKICGYEIRTAENITVSACDSSVTRSNNNNRNLKPKHTRTDTLIRQKDMGQWNRTTCCNAGWRTQKFQLPGTSHSLKSGSYVNWYCLNVKSWTQNPKRRISVTHFALGMLQCQITRMPSISNDTSLLTRDRTQFFLDASLSRAQETLRLGLVSPSSTSPQ